MTIHNQWGTKPDPKTGLPPYPARTASTVNRLNQRARDAAERRAALQKQLDRLTETYADTLVEVDRLSTTRQRIAAQANAARKS